MFNPLPQLDSYLIRKVGTRGVCLLIFGFIWMVLGMSFAVDPQARFSQPAAGGVLGFLDHGVGLLIFALMWLVGGALAVGVAFRRTITHRDDLGFNGVCLPPFLWGSAYWWSFSVNILSGGLYGRPGTYLAGIVYWSFTVLLMFLSRHLKDADREEAHGHST